MLGRLSDEVFRMDEALKKEIGTREARQKQLRDEMQYELQSQHKFMESFFK